MSAASAFEYNPNKPDLGTFLGRPAVRRAWGMRRRASTARATPPSTSERRPARRSTPSADGKVLIADGRSGCNEHRLRKLRRHQPQHRRRAGADFVRAHEQGRRDRGRDRHQGRDHRLRRTDGPSPPGRISTSRSTAPESFRRQPELRRLNFLTTRSQAAADTAPPRVCGLA